MATKLLADSNRAALRQIAEGSATWGEVPANGTTREVRFTSSSIVVNKETAVSDEIRADRMVSSITETGMTSGGDINFEFAAGTIDDFLAGVLQGAWSRPMTMDVWRGPTVAIGSTSTVTINGGDYTNYFTNGRHIRTTGFINPANNVYATIASTAFAAGVTTITVSGTPFSAAEEGSAYTQIADANDVIILNDTGIRFGTSAADEIDGNTSDPFAAAIAANQIAAGQWIFVHTPDAYETGTFTCATVVTGDTVTIDDGVNDPVILTADTDFTVGVSDTADATALAAAINAQRVAGNLNVSAVSSVGVVTVTNYAKTGGTLSSSDGVTLAVSAFSGGSATLGGWYELTAVADDVLTVVGTLPAFAAGSAVTIKGSMLRNPGNVSNITPQSYSLETTFTDVTQNFITDGLRAGGVDLDITAGSIITGTIRSQGRETKRQAQVLHTAPYTALDAAATEVTSATANVGTLRAAGAVLSSAVKSVKINIDGQLRNQMAIGNKFPVGIVAGRLQIGVNVEAYFEDGANFDAFLAHSTRDIVVPIVDLDSNEYRITVPSFKINSDPVAPGGIDQDVMETMDGMAFRDATRDAMIQFDRVTNTLAVGI